MTPSAVLGSGVLVLLVVFLRSRQATHDKSRARELRALSGRHLHVSWGFKVIQEWIGVLEAGASDWSVSLTSEDGQSRVVPVAEVRLVRDATTGETLAGPWS